MDNKKKTGNPDRQRINLNEDYELRDWSKKFGVTTDQLKKAVQAVGSSSKDVEAYLKSNGQ